MFPAHFCHVCADNNKAAMPDEEDKNGQRKLTSTFGTSSRKLSARAIK